MKKIVDYLKLVGGRSVPPQPEEPQPFRIPEGLTGEAARQYIIDHDPRLDELRKATERLPNGRSPSVWIEADPPPQRGDHRFWKYLDGSDGILEGDLGWVNEPEDTYPESWGGGLGLQIYEKPARIIFRKRTPKRLPDLFAHRRTHVCSQAFLDLVLELDPQAIEHMDCEITLHDGSHPEHKFYMIDFVRTVDVVDWAKSNYEVLKLIMPDKTVLGYRVWANECQILPEIRPDWHVTRVAFHNRLFFSGEIKSRIEKQKLKVKSFTDPAVFG